MLLLGAAAMMMLASCTPKEESKYKYETVEGDLTEARIYTLDNGLTVYLSVNNEEPRIQTYIAVRTGSKTTSRRVMKNTAPLPTPRNAASPTTESTP